MGRYKSSNELDVSLSIDSTRPTADVYFMYFMPVEDFKKVQVDLSWLPALIDDSSKKLTVEDMRTYSSGFLDLMRKNQPETIDKILKQVITNTSSVETIVTCLRTNYSIKHLLHNWKQVLKVSQERIASLGKDPSKVLSGLL